MRDVRFFSGSGAPSVAPSVSGDFYFDTAAEVLYQASGNTPAWVQVLPLTAGASQAGSGAGAPELVSSFRFDVPVGAGGAPDDVTLFAANLPSDMEVIGATFLVTTAVALMSVQVRDAVGGGGNAITGPLSAGATGRVVESAGGGLSNAGPFPSGSSWFLRRGDSGIGGVLILLCRYA